MSSGFRDAWARNLLGLLLFALFASAVQAPAFAQPGKRVALLIGNQSYSGEPGNEKGEWPRLSNPINDVTELARALERFGFKATVLKDLNKQQMLQAIEDFGRQSRGAEATVVYYAGHGAERDLVNYLIPRDAGPLDARGTSIEANGVRLAKILEALAGNGATNIVFIDACRKLPGGRGPSGAAGMAPQQAPPGTIISFAARPGTAALDGYGMRNGLYAQGLLKAFSGTDLSLIGVLAEAGRVVQGLSNGHQVPESYGSDHLRVSFRFANSTQPASAPTQSTLAPAEAGKLTATTPTRPLPGTVLKDCDVCPSLVVLPRGSFTMGSPEREPKRRINEGPQLVVWIDYDLAVGRYELTQREWTDVMGSNPSHFKGCDDCPVENVSWNDAQEYLTRLNQRTGGRFGYRLLSEAEWEYMARGVTRSDAPSTAFWWGNAIDPSLANYAGGHAYNGGPSGVYRAKTTPVGVFKANSFGVYDVHGNVREWVQNTRHANY